MYKRRCKPKRKNRLQAVSEILRLVFLQERSNKLQCSVHALSVFSYKSQLTAGNLNERGPKGIGREQNSSPFLYFLLPPVSRTLPHTTLDLGSQLSSRAHRIKNLCGQTKATEASSCSYLQLHGQHQTSHPLGNLVSRQLIGSLS